MAYSLPSYESPSRSPLKTSSRSYSAGKFSKGRNQPRLAKIGVSYRPMYTRSNWPLPCETSVVTRCRRMFSSTTTQLSLISGFFSSNLLESFFSRIISGLLTTAIVTVFCWARALAAVSRAARITRAKRWIIPIHFGYRSWHWRRGPRRRLLEQRIVVDGAFAQNRPYDPRFQRRQGREPLAQAKTDGFCVKRFHRCLLDCRAARVDLSSPKAVSTGLGVSLPSPRRGDSRWGRTKGRRTG